MYRPEPSRRTPVMTYEQMLERIRYEGAYPTRERADGAARAVLAGLGRQLTGQERADLSAALPLEAALAVSGQAPAAEPLTGWGFVKDLAARTGTSPAVARWDTGSVFSALAVLAGPDLLTRVIAQLPPGYALLFGRAELVQAA
ncbi:DUF2267 domain-containing protein [Streptomyces sp. NPDC087420]|uniref:DUF2267 domain-containing protein n=1 Tax=Streptomyces sp. NPDC087420 TaxID=3365785 RepID=UPI0038346D99